MEWLVVRQHGGCCAPGRSARAVGPTMENPLRMESLREKRTQRAGRHALPSGHQRQHLAGLRIGRRHVRLSVSIAYLCRWTKHHRGEHRWCSALPPGKGK